MTTLLLDGAIANVFDRRVAPVLAARGLAARGGSLEQMVHFLQEELRAWPVTVRRPVVGAIEQVDFSRRPPRCLDCGMRVPDVPDEVRGEAAVIIQNVFGTTATGQLCREALPQSVASDASTTRDGGDALRSKSAQPSRLLMLTCSELTLLADVLPGKDCWIAVEAWPNERLPMPLVIQRPAKPYFVPAREIEVVALERERTGFAVACDKCDGEGTLECNRCQGSGIHKPRKTCPKCGGSGNFIGKYGDVMGSCNACDGRGYWVQIDCNGCDGSGSVDCYRCHAMGVVYARFSIATGTYSIVQRQKDGSKATCTLAASEITIFDWESGAEVALRTGAASMLQKVLDATGALRACDPDEVGRITEHCRELHAIEHCLSQSLEAEDVRETRPICVGRPEASVQRSRGGVVYEFPVVSGMTKRWMSEGLLPFPLKTPVQLEQRQPEGELARVDLPLQGTPVVGKHIAPVLVGCSGRGRSYRLAIRFAVDIDASSLPPEMYLKRDAPPPPEVPQLRHLRRWCSPDNWDHPVIHAIVSPRKDEKRNEQIRLFSTSIAKFPRQVTAVELGISDNPLGLIKGPPGTGKTKVITEIVRQMVGRGKKVLVCSQTHQAVTNVLERLHSEGGIRMIRHRREEDLTEIEMLYRAGGMEDEYCTSVRTRSQAALAAHRERLAILSKAMDAFPRARDAAARLADVRRILIADLERLAQQRTDKLGVADRVFTRQQKDVETKAHMATVDAERRNRSTQRELKRVRSAIRKTERRRDAAERRHIEKSGNQPNVVEVASTWKTKLRDALVPNWMVGTNALQERYSWYCRCLDTLHPIEKELLKRTAAIAAEIESIRQALEKSIASFTAEHAASTAASESQYAEEVATAKHQANTEETQLRAVQSAAVPFSPEVGLSLTDDARPALWQAAIEQAEQEHGRTSERAEFLSGWLRDIEAEPVVLMNCCWDHLQVFFSTCVGLGSWRRLVERGLDAVDLVIIDEAAHATASETLIPMQYSRRTLLIGDEMQLPPTPPSHVDKCKRQCPIVAAAEVPGKDTSFGGIAGAVQMSPCWLERSLFEWLWRKRPEIPRVMLDTQFRMHPAIADFVSSVFYPEGLHNGVGENARTIAFGEFTRPVCLIPTSAYKDRFEEYLDPGYRNCLEARIVRRVLEKAERELAEPQDVGVITPYAHQVELIVKELDIILPAFHKVRLTPEHVASVDSFQGSERDVIIISFVRSPASCQHCDGKGRRSGQYCMRCQGKGWRGTGLTFARDLRRLNVAFSRARKALILVGDIDALTNARYRGGRPGGHVLTMFQEYVSNRGKVLHLWERENDGK